MIHCDITGTGSEPGNESSQRDMGTMENRKATNRTDAGAMDVTDMNDSMDEISMVKYRLRAMINRLAESDYLGERVTGQTPRPDKGVKRIPDR